MFKTCSNKKDFEEIALGSSKKVFIPVWCELIGDLETPVSLYNKLASQASCSFLLEAAEKGEYFGRYSFIGIDALYSIDADNNGAKAYNCINNQVIMENSNPYLLIKNFLKNFDIKDLDIPYTPGLVGYLGYDSVRFIEPVLDDFYKNVDKCTTFPESRLIVPELVLVFDHFKHKIYIICNVLADEDCNVEKSYLEAQEKISKIYSKIGSPHSLKPIELSENSVDISISSNKTKEEWEYMVDKAKDHIKNGDIFQVVLSQRFAVKQDELDGFTIYRALRSINPSPYLYYLNFEDFKIVGSSPEIMIKGSADGTAQVRPIAGTKKRGKNLQEDNKLADELLQDPKERAEHIMLVDLGRNDLGRVCKYGTVKVDDLMIIEKFSHVQHIVSNVTGELKENLDAVDLISASFPAGTLSGAPKVKAMEIIYELEKEARGPYGGCIGIIGFNNEVNMAITIRTVLIKDNKLFIQAGAGIVADSNADFEYKECQSKAAALVQTIARLKK